MERLSIFQQVIKFLRIWIKELTRDFGVQDEGINIVSKMNWTGDIYEKDAATLVLHVFILQPTAITITKHQIIILEENGDGIFQESDLVITILSPLLHCIILITTNTMYDKCLV